jgi:hypothetical protein
MAAHLLLERTTMAILRPVRFCWNTMFWSQVTSASKPACSAARRSLLESPRFFESDPVGRAVIAGEILGEIEGRADIGQILDGGLAGSTFGFVGRYQKLSDVVFHVVSPGDGTHIAGSAARRRRCRNSFISVVLPLQIFVAGHGQRRWPWCVSRNTEEKAGRRFLLIDRSGMDIEGNAAAVILPCVTDWKPCLEFSRRDLSLVVPFRFPNRGVNRVDGGLGRILIDGFQGALSGHGNGFATAARQCLKTANNKHSGVWARCSTASLQVAMSAALDLLEDVFDLFEGIFVRVR